MHKPVVALLVIALFGILPLAASGTRPRAVACSAPETLPAPPAARPGYALRVRIRPGLRRASGRLRATFTPERATDRIVFRLWANAPVMRARGAALTVADVRVEGAPAAVARPSPTTLVVRRALAAAETATVSLTFDLRLPNDSRARLYGGSVARLASFFPLLAWDPNEGWLLDPPSAIGWETWTSPTADFDVTVTAPRGLRVLASGEQIAATRWRAESVRDFALAAGRFAVVRGSAAAPEPVQVVVAVERGHRLAARRLLAWARAALEGGSRRFGPYPWSTLTLVATESERFSFEYPTLVFVSATEPAPRQATAHEVAHQWFYSLVGNNQARDPWLDEGLATWAQARLTGTLAQVVMQPLSEFVQGKLGQPMRFWDDFDLPLVVEGIYIQGAQALASLGDPDEVDCALRRYVAENAYTTATPRDLLRALEQSFPDARAKLEAFGARFGRARSR